MTRSADWIALGGKSATNDILILISNYYGWVYWNYCLDFGVTQLNDILYIVGEIMHPHPPPYWA